MKRSFYFLVFISALTLGSCKKDSGNNNTPDNLMKDEVLAKTRDAYLWFNQIPASFNPRIYADPNKIMEAIREYSKEPGFTDPVDDFSFAMKTSDWMDISAGKTTDFGLNIYFHSEYDLRVRMVEPNSPAGIAGVRRGWRITSVNGNTNIHYTNAKFIADNIYGSSSCTVVFEKPDGGSVQLSFNAAEYQQSPVYLDTVYDAGGRKAGYLVFNSFLGSTSAVATQLADVFTRFVNKNVTDVIVDLRYNGGGYVSLQEKLANYLIKPSLNGSVMMGQEYNSLHSDKDTTVKFEKLGGLNIQNIYFIVGDNTASASELLINNLKPYMTVKLIGSTTFGKPVGFYGIEVKDWVIFPVSFRNTNGLGQGNYFDGIAVDREVVDGLDKDWGDRNEARLASALQHIESGSFGYAPQYPGLNSVLESELRPVNDLLNPKSFKGAILNK